MLLLSTILVLAAKRAHLHQSLSSLGWPLYMSDFALPVWGYTALNLGCAIAIAKAPKLGLLASRALQRLGKVSYGFYIFHLPVIWTAAMLTQIDRGAFDLPNLIVGILAFAVTWLVAELSFRFLESPFLRLKGRLAAIPQRTPVAPEPGELSEGRREDPARG
jgi:peptidoglycan/LPS O-acetylase OafA/YrhL